MDLSLGRLLRLFWCRYPGYVVQDAKPQGFWTLYSGALRGRSCWFENPTDKEVVLRFFDDNVPTKLTDFDTALAELGPLDSDGGPPTLKLAPGGHRQVSIRSGGGSGRCKLKYQIVTPDGTMSEGGNGPAMEIDDP